MQHSTQRSRRSFLQSAPLVAAGTLAACGQAEQQAAPAVQSQQRFKWKMVTTWPKDFPALGTGANNLAHSIEALSDGRLHVKVYGAGELVPASGVFDAVSGGTAEMGHGAAYYWKGKHEATQFSRPFLGLNAAEINGWLRYGGGQSLWDELYADFNLRAFPIGNTGVQMGGWFNREINTLSDFSGLVMRMPGLGGEVLRRLEVTVKALPGGEIFQALKTGAIDATEWVGPYNDLAFGLHQAGQYYYWPGWHEPGTALECMVNKQALEALPADLQGRRRIRLPSSQRRHAQRIHRAQQLRLKTLVEEHGVQLRRFSTSSWRKSAKYPPK